MKFSCLHGFAKTIPGSAASISANRRYARWCGRDLYGLRSDGQEFSIEIGLSPVQTTSGLAVLASIVDITERKRAERRFRLAVESSPLAKVMINQDGRIVLVNRQTEVLFGYQRQELLGELVEVLVPGALSRTSSGLSQRLLGEAQRSRNGCRPRTVRPPQRRQRVSD
ncbi:MAG: PAS domain S-box protein [Pirellulales bacterium]